MNAHRVRIDGLWPVLLALCALIAGAVSLEHVAERRPGGRVVSIEASADVVDEDVEGEDRGGFSQSVALDEQHAQARTLARRGQLDEAFALYREVERAHPAVASVYAELGYWQLAADEPQAARAELERAVSLDARDPWVHLNLGIALARGGEARAAEASYRRALELRPGFDAAQLALGNGLRRQGRIDEAIDILRQAAGAGSNDQRARALVALGHAQIVASQREEAAHSFDRAIEYAPAAVEIRVGAARAWMNTGQHTDVRRAVGLLERAALMAPDVAPIYSALGRAREKLDEVAAAEEAYAHAVRLDPDYRYARRRLLRLALDRRDFPQARAAADYLLATGPDEPEHHFLAGLVAARDERPEDARTHYRAAIARAGGDYPEAYFNLALVEKNQGRLDDAVAAYQKAIELRPTYREAWNNLGLTLAAAGKPDDGEAALRHAITIDEHYAAAWLNLGELLGERGRDDDAIAAFERALQERPDYPEAQLDLGAALIRAGRAVEAVAVDKALVTARPRYVAAWYNLGLALDATGDHVAAADAWRRALSIDPEHLPSMRKRAANLAANGAADAAVAAWQEVVDRAPDDDVARLALAEVHLRIGDHQACARDLRGLPPATARDSRAVHLFRSCSSP